MKTICILHETQLECANWTVLPPLDGCYLDECYRGRLLPAYIAEVVLLIKSPQKELVVIY